MQLHDLYKVVFNHKVHKGLHKGLKVIIDYPAISRK